MTALDWLFLVPAVLNLALVAVLVRGEIRHFKNGRDFAAANDGTVMIPVGTDTVFPFEGESK